MVVPLPRSAFSGHCEVLDNVVSVSALKQRDRVYGHSWPSVDRPCHLLTGADGEHMILGNWKPEYSSLCDHTVSERRNPEEGSAIPNHE